MRAAESDYESGVHISSLLRLRPGLPLTSLEMKGPGSAEKKPYLVIQAPSLPVSLVVISVIFDAVGRHLTVAYTIVGSVQNVKKPDHFSFSGVFDSSQRCFSLFLSYILHSRLNTDLVYILIIVGCCNKQTGRASSLSPRFLKVAYQIPVMDVCRGRVILQ